jgi:hypothetical protein
MQCNTIRLLLPYLDQPGELGDADSVYIEHHLATCASCRETVARDRAFDASVARAMSGVEVPSVLRNQLAARLAENDRGMRQRRRVARGSTLAALAALVVLGLSFPLGWWTPRVDITAELLLQEDFGDQLYVMNRSVDSAEGFFRNRGLKTELPRDFDYSLLVNLGVANLKGREVARLDFQAGAGRAQVYVLPRRQFNVPGANPANFSAPGSGCSVEIIDSGRDYIYVVVLYGDATTLQMFQAKGLVG